MCYLNIRREYKFYCLQFYLEEKFIAKSCSSWTKPFNLRGNWESISKLLSFSLCCCSSVMFKPVQLTFVRCSPFKLAFFFSFPFFFPVFCQISCWLIQRCPLAQLFHPCSQLHYLWSQPQLAEHLMKNSCDHMNFLSCKWWFCFVSAIFLLLRHFF